MEEVVIWWSWLFTWETKPEMGTMTVRMASFVLWEIRVYVRLQGGTSLLKVQDLDQQHRGHLGVW